MTNETYLTGHFFYAVKSTSNMEYPASYAVKLASYQVSSGINTQEDEKQDGKAPERTASITEERKRNTDYRRQSQHHSHINK